MGVADRQKGPEASTSGRGPVLAPTPRYNAGVLEDMLALEHAGQLHAALREAPRLVDGVLLVKVSRGARFRNQFNRVMWTRLGLKHDQLKLAACGSMMSHMDKACWSSVLTCPCCSVTSCTDKACSSSVLAYPCRAVTWCTDKGFVFSRCCGSEAVAVGL